MKEELTGLVAQLPTLGDRTVVGGARKLNSFGGEK